MYDYDPKGPWENWEQIHEIIVTDTVAAIGEYAFRNLPNLTNVKMLLNVLTIGDYCFSGSYNLWQLTFQDDAPSIGTGAFKGPNATAYYPGDNATWTSDIIQNYGGTITWKAN